MFQVQGALAGVCPEYRQGMCTCAVLLVRCVSGPDRVRQGVSDKTIVLYFVTKFVTMY